MVGFICLSVEVGLMDGVTPGASMALSGMGGRVGGEEYSRYAFPVLPLSLGRIINLCVCVPVRLVCLFACVTEPLFLSASP